MERSTRATSRKTKRMVLARNLKRLTYPNNKMFKGGFKNNNPHGKGTLYQPDGVIINGVWDMGDLISKS